MLIDRYMQMLREEAEYDIYDIYDEGEGLDAFAKKLENDKKMDKAVSDYKAWKAAVIEKNMANKDPFGGGKLQKVKKQRKPITKEKAGKALVGTLAAGAAVAGGAAAYNAIKKHRAKKAKEVAVEEGVSLEEAFDFVLECEQMLLDEGYEFYEIYDEGEGLDAFAKKLENDKKMDKAVSDYKAWKAAVIEKNMAKKDPFGGGKLQKVKKPRKPLGKGAKIGLGVAGGLAAGGAAVYGIKKLRDKKAKEVAVEEGVSLEEAMMWVLECEQEYLNEGYDFEDIYDIDEYWD